MVIKKDVGPPIVLVSKRLTTNGSVTELYWSIKDEWWRLCLPLQAHLITTAPRPARPRRRPLLTITFSVDLWPSSTAGRRSVDRGRSAVINTAFEYLKLFVSAPAMHSVFAHRLTDMLFIWPRVWSSFTAETLRVTLFCQRSPLHQPSGITAPCGGALLSFHHSNFCLQ